MAEDTQIADSGATVQLSFEDTDHSQPAREDVRPTDRGSSDEANAETQPDTTGDADPKNAKRVRDTLAALQDAQRGLHESKREYAETMKALAEMKGELTALKTVRESVLKEPEEPEEDALDAKEAWAADFEADPVGTLLKLGRQVRADTARLLDMRDGHLTESQKRAIAEALNPERQALQPDIATLSKHEWFTKLDDASQLEAAKVFHAKTAGKAAATREDGALRAPLGGPGGTGRAAERQTVDEAKKKAEALADQLWPDTFGNGKVDIQFA